MGHDRPTRHTRLREARARGGAPTLRRWDAVVFALAASHCGSVGRVRPGDSSDAVVAHGDIRVHVRTGDCSQDRIAKIFAIPGVLQAGQRTLVQVEAWPDAVVGDASVVFSASIEVDAAMDVIGQLGALANLDALQAGNFMEPVERTADEIGQISSRFKGLMNELGSLFG